MIKKKHIRLSIFTLCLISGVVFGVLSRVLEDEMSLKFFSNKVHSKEKIAEKNIQTLKNQIVTARDNGKDIVSEINLKKNENQDIFYYVIEDDKLIYWSDNHLDIKSLDVPNLKDNSFIELSNASCILKIDTVDNLNLLALIKIKNNYGVNNKYVTSDFAKGFLLDNSVGTTLEFQEKGAVYNSQGDYIFSLTEMRSVRNIKILFYLHIFFLFLAFALYGFLYYNLDVFFGSRIFKLKNYLIVTAIYIAIPMTLLFLKIPHTLFEHRIFSPLLYFGTAPSLGHLLIITLLTAFVILTLYFKVSFDVKQRVLFVTSFQIVFTAFFMLIIRIIYNFIYNSTIEIFNFPPQNDEVYSMIALSIIVLWFLIFCFSYRKFVLSVQKIMRNSFIVLINAAVALILCLVLFLFKNSHFVFFSVSYFLLVSLIQLFIYLSETNYSLLYLSILCYLISIFIVYYILINHQENQYNNAEVVADNLISQGDIIYSDFLDKDFLSTLEKNILRDKTVKEYVQEQLDVNLTQTTRLLQHIKKHYINRNFYESYNLNAFLIPRFSPEMDVYNNTIALEFKLITRNFYYNVQQNRKLAYIGIFNFFDGVRPYNLILEIEKKINTSVSNGYPDRIFDNTANNISQKFSSALYKKNNLIYEAGYFTYPMEYNFKISNPKNNSVNFANYIHYVFDYDDDLQIVVSCEQMDIQNTYVLNLTYFAIAFFIFIFFIRLTFDEKISKKEKSITDDLRKSFIYVVVFALSIVILSITYFIVQEYRETQKRELKLKIKYISADINEYFTQRDDNADASIIYDASLIDLTKVLSRKYETDIQIYNAFGELIVTTRPYVFTNGFISNLINPDYFFEEELTDVIKTENIGSLEYLAIYSAIFDADKNNIASLEVPMFFSMEQLRSETILYLATIANIFFLILIGSILLNYWLSQRITVSISKIGESLKNIAVGGKNLKMEVKESEKMDEIEKLMLQYNTMVDELEKNTNILLENERNFAWRDMAKQIAHEIKNPLTPMKLSIQQLQRIKEIKPEEFNDYFDKMSPILIEQINNLSKIASSFSNFAKIQTENFVKIDITQKLFSTVELFKNNTKNIEIIYERPPDPIFVITDREQILEVFNNIFKNAIQAIPSGRQGKINVSVTLNGENVLIAISDNGCGITKEDRKNIFTPNFSTKSSGTGLGLSIAKHIIEASNGKIWFNSKVNQCTTFFIELKTSQG